MHVYNIIKKLTDCLVYNIPTGPTDGIMEFVRGSMPISAVLSSYGNSLSAYLKHFNPEPHSPYGVKPEAMEMFVRSCAASCVVTFILGIGDRSDIIILCYFTMKSQVVISSYCLLIY
jgi:hypothetical protein